MSVVDKFSQRKDSCMTWRVLRTASRFLRPLHKVFLKDGGQPARLALARRSVNEDFLPLTDDEAKALVNSVNWYHRLPNSAPE